MISIIIYETRAVVRQHDPFELAERREHGGWITCPAQRSDAALEFAIRVSKRACILQKHADTVKQKGWSDRKVWPSQIGFLQTPSKDPRLSTDQLF